MNHYNTEGSIILKLIRKELDNVGDSPSLLWLFPNNGEGDQVVLRYFWIRAV